MSEQPDPELEASRWLRYAHDDARMALAVLGQEDGVPRIAAFLSAPEHFSHCRLVLATPTSVSG